MILEILKLKAFCDIFYIWIELINKIIQFAKFKYIIMKIWDIIIYRNIGKSGILQCIEYRLGKIDSLIKFCSLRRRTICHIFSRIQLQINRLYFKWSEYKRSDFIFACRQRSFRWLPFNSIYAEIITSIKSLKSVTQRVF